MCERVVQLKVDTKQGKKEIIWSCDVKGLRKKRSVLVLWNERCRCCTVNNSYEADVEAAEVDTDGERHAIPTSDHRTRMWCQGRDGTRNELGWRLKVCPSAYACAKSRQRLKRGQAEEKERTFDYEQTEVLGSLVLEFVGDYLRFSG